MQDTNKSDQEQRADETDKLADSLQECADEEPYIPVVVIAGHRFIGPPCERINDAKMFVRAARKHGLDGFVILESTAVIRVSTDP